eukprot:m.297052 g.297052  ORF g.297052 m.297052 type:complete len:149 (+) comp40767_c1_seq36:4749-5195(+)
MVRVYIDHSSARLLPPPVLTLKSTARMRAFHLVSALSTLCVLLAHPKPPKAPCDDGKHGIAIDLPFLTKASYGCQTTKEEAAYRETNHTSKNCADPHPAEHVCMNVKINYTESLPSRYSRGGYSFPLYVHMWRDILQWSAPAMVGCVR